MVAFVSPKRQVKVTARGSCIPLLLALALVIIYYPKQVVNKDRKHNVVRNKGNIRVKPASNERRSNSKQNKAPTLQQDNIRLDFIVAGFPKCGTTTLLHSFIEHNETMIAPDEFCEMDRTNTDLKSRFEKLKQVLENMPNPSEQLVKRGIKCPMAVWDARGIHHLSSNYKHARIIVGLRHPVLLFESFYNYRVTEMYNLMDIVTPPSPNDLIGNTWRDVSTDLTRYELSFMQLGKTVMSSPELSDLGSHGKRLSPTCYQIFLYTIEQLSDPDERRARNFRSDLQRFLRLESPLERFKKSNTNTIRREESIDICDPLYDELRKLLVRQGKDTARWIRDQLLESEDVFVGGRDHFLRLLDTWEHDPCLRIVRPTNFNGRPIKI